jgi:periplasmic protein TonB
MVLTQRHPHAQTEALHLAIAGVQPVRVLGMAGAIALNVAALMLLLVPVSAPVPMSKAEETDTIFIDDRIKPPPPPPIEVPVVKPTTIRDTRPTPVTPTTPQPIQDQNVIVPDGSEYVPPTNADPLPDIGPALPVNPDPQPSTRLEYASAPAPAYPRDELLDGKEGTVVLRVLVDVDGKPLSVEIERSSGHRKLDEAARRQVLRKWMFRPAIRNGQAVQVYGIVPVSFSLSRQ